MISYTSLVQIEDVIFHVVKMDVAPVCVMGSETEKKPSKKKESALVGLQKLESEGKRIPALQKRGKGNPQRTCQNRFTGRK